MANFLEGSMGGNKTGWPRIKNDVQNHDNNMRVVWCNTYTVLKWDLIALSTCPCYIALEGSLHNAAPIGALAVCHDGDCSHLCHR